MNFNVEQSTINIPTENRVKPEKKPRPPAKTCSCKTSTFFITINSNFVVSTASEQEYLQFKAKFEMILDDFTKNLDKFTIFKTSKMGLSFGYGENDGNDILLKEDRILENKVLWALEEGPKTHKLHAHILFYMKKRGVDTKLDLVKIREHFKTQIGNAVYIHYALENKKNTTHSDLEKYLSKAPIE